MDLHLLSDDERRAHCRRELEALELWVRRLIHETFSAAHGPEYLNATAEGGRRIVKKGVADDIADRLAKEPTRYGRPIDAAHLDDLRTIICNPENWRHSFGGALAEAFPLGREEARTFLGRLVEIRHKLSHANPISVHEAARVICYTQDVISVLKGHYMKLNQEREYNVPTIIRVADCLGNVAYLPEMSRKLRHRGDLRPGERLSIEVDVDPSFERSSYHITWQWPGMYLEEQADTDRIVIGIENRHVRKDFRVRCLVTSTMDWHRFGKYDDEVSIFYKVLPPLS